MISNEQFYGTVLITRLNGDLKKTVYKVQK